MTSTEYPSHPQCYMEKQVSLQIGSTNRSRGSKNRRDKGMLQRDNSCRAGMTYKRSLMQPQNSVSIGNKNNLTRVCKQSKDHPLKRKGIHGTTMLTNNVMSNINQVPCALKNGTFGRVEKFCTRNAIPDMLKLLQDWNFNALKYFSVPNSEFTPAQLVVAMFEDLGLLSVLCIDAGAFELFVLDIVSKYRTDVPFHNFNHALTIVHMSYLILKSESALRTRVLSKMDQFVLLVAAACHDIDHDGFSNSYHQQAFTSRATRYPCKNIQERHHLQVTMDLLRNHYTTTFVQFDQDQIQVLEDIIESCILSTDMGKHFALKADFDAWLLDPNQRELKRSLEMEKKSDVKVLYDNTPISPSSISSSSTVFSSSSNGSFATISHVQNDVLSIESRKVVLGIILHCVDLSNSVRPFEIYNEWVSRLTEEFLHQVEVEQAAQLESLDMMKASTDKEIAIREIGFIKHIVIPIWESFSSIAPTCKRAIIQANENIAKFQNVVEANVIHKNTKQM